MSTAIDDGDWELAKLYNKQMNLLLESPHAEKTYTQMMKQLVESASEIKDPDEEAIKDMCEKIRNKWSPERWAFELRKGGGSKQTPILEEATFGLYTRNSAFDEHVPLNNLRDVPDILPEKDEDDWALCKYYLSLRRK